MSLLVVLLLWSTPAWWHLNSRRGTANILGTGVDLAINQLLWYRQDGALDILIELNHENIIVDLKNGTGADGNKHPF